MVALRLPKDSIIKAGNTYKAINTSEKTWDDGAVLDDLAMLLEQLLDRRIGILGVTGRGEGKHKGRGREEA